jgi:sigma-E factor negative regulatory protein RseC
MMQTQAVVIRREGEKALVESVQGGGCGHCDSVNGCSSSKLSFLFGSAPRRFHVRNDANAQVGDLVEINLPEGVLLHSAAVMYMLPLIFLFFGAILGALWSSEPASSDLHSAAGGLLGLVFGFLLVKYFSFGRHLSSSSLPVILSD